MKTVLRTETGIAYNVDVYNDGWGWIAITEDYDGPEDRFNSATGRTKEEAIESLSENLLDREDHWRHPNELDYLKSKAFKFIEQTGLLITIWTSSLEDALDSVPIGSRLISITK
jgi:hypothetical protein